MEGMTLEKLQVIIEAQTKEYTQAMNKVQNQTKQTTNSVESQVTKIKGAFKKIAAAVGIALSVAAILSFGKACITLGSDLAEVQNVVDVTFGSLSDNINDFAKDAIENFGLSELSAKKFTSTMGAMLKSMGFSSNQAADMSMKIAGLSGDMASFYNLTGDEAFAKIRAGISGETEPLKQLGINLSVANLEAFALSQGMNTAYNSMTQQEQALLRYNYLLSVTADAQGDFARTSDSWANQTKILAEKFNSLKASIGQGLINVFTPVLKVLNMVISKLQVAADAFKRFTEIITGKKAQASSSVGNISTDATTATDAMDGLTDSTSAAGSAAKSAAQKYSGLAGFDEINSLTKNDSSGSGSGAGGSSDYGDLADTAADTAEETQDSLNPVLDLLANKLKELKELFKSGFMDGLGSVNLKPIQKALAGIKTSLKDIFTDSNVVAAANRYIDTMAYTLGQKVGAITSVDITIVTNLLGGIDKYLAQNKERIKSWMINIFDISSETATIEGNFATAMANIFSVFGGENGQKLTANIIGMFADGFMGATELIAKLSRDITDVITRPFIDNQEGFKTLFDGIIGIIAENARISKELIDNTFDKANEVYDQNLKPMFDAIAEGLSTLTKTALNAWEQYFLPVYNGLTEKFGKFADEHLQPMIDKALELIGTIASAITDIWQQTIVPFLDWFIANVAPYIAIALEWVGSAFYATRGVIADVLGYIFEALGGLIEYIAGVFTGDWDRAWEGIKTFFSSIWAAITTILSAALNAIGIIFSTIFTAIKTTVVTIFNTIKTNIANVIAAIKTVIATALSSIQIIWDSIWTSMKNSVVTIFNAIWSSIKGVINSILGGIESMANGVVSGVNTIINALNGLKFDIPDWVPGMGGKSWSMSIPTLSTVSLPRLATGGVVDGPTAAIIGEAGKEAVVPLENNTGWMDKVANRIGEIFSINLRSIMEDNSDGEWQNITTVVKLDNKTLVEQTDKYRKRKGYTLAPT